MTDTRKPNILFISSDQHRADSLGCYGHPIVRTPHLDKLAAAGVRFTNAYSDCPVCIPQRTTWITGIKSHTYGMPEYAENYRIHRKREQMLGSLITQAGYQTALIGKTHWHTDPSFRGGFETLIRETRLAELIQRESGRPGSTFSGIGFNEFHAAPNHLPASRYSTDWLVDQSIDFLEHRDRTQPFFLWLSMTDPHPPNTIHEPYYSMYDDEDIPETEVGEWTQNNCPLVLQKQREAHNYPRKKDGDLKKTRGVYYGKITNLDHQIGRLFGKLQSEQLFNDTWIVYTTDHGECLGDHELFSKRNFLNSSAQVPVIVRPPNSFKFEKGKVIDALVCLDDLLPTFCDAADTVTPNDITGKSWLPLLSGKSETLHPFEHGNIAGSHMYHDGRYKYLYNIEDGSELLFDTQNDPHDINDLSDQKELKNRLRNAFIEHLKEEGHPHIVDGKLLNENQKTPPINEMRAVMPNGWAPIGEGCWPV